MYRLVIKGREVWDDNKEEFITVPGCDCNLEHSLVSISKWEAKYKKSFSNTTDKTAEEWLDYIKMMVVDNPIESDLTLLLLTEEQMKGINSYINDSMTATTFSKEDTKKIEKAGTNHFVTSEEIYYWMTTQNIPIECERWHLNRLITLVRICAIKNKPEDKKNKRMTSADLAERRAQMQAARARFKAKK